MVVTQAAESGGAMRALSLLGVLVIAKLLVLSGRPTEISALAPIAYFWQDVLVTLAFALFDRATRRTRAGWVLYGIAVAYVTINVPIARLLSSPLTWSMLNAAGSALSDSIKRHVTPLNIGLMSLVVACAFAFPMLLRRMRFENLGAVVAAGVLVVALGPWATSRVETQGLGRNAIVALVSTGLHRFPGRAISRRAAGEPNAADWRASPVDAGDPGESLSRLSGAAKGRNVVLVVLESAGAEYLSTYGAARDPMPNLSRLARQALVFEQAYAVYPESIKEFFSVLCSIYPAMDTATESYADISTASLASLFKESGYRTALFHSGRFMYLGMYAVIANRGYDVLHDAGAIGGNHQSSFGVDEPSTVRRMLEWLDSLERGERFFLTYLPIAGHHPYDTPEPGPFPEEEESDRYLNALHYGDSALGSLVDGLRARELYENTVFVFLGDHGQAFGQHHGNYGHSLFLYEENIRVPYLIVAPGLIDEEVRIARPISLIDTAPTIVDLLGLASPEGNGPELTSFQGRSALEQQNSMALFFTDYSLRLMGLRDGCWKYIYEMDSGRSKLFNLCEDPRESRDLSSQNRDRVAAYSEHLLKWSSAQKASIVKQQRAW
jgi:arylsulfatase A-like enzyme